MWRNNRSYARISFLPLNEIVYGIPPSTLSALEHLRGDSYFKGGVAREILLNVMGRKSVPLGPRDFDVVYLGPYDYRVEDYYEDLGWDFEYKGSMVGFFRSTDIGVNQALLGKDGLYFSEKARREATQRRARLTPYEYRHDYSELGYETPVSPRVNLRVLLISLREGLDYSPQTLQYLRDDPPSSFTLLIFLFKAFETGVEDEFFGVLKQALGSELDGDDPEELLLNTYNNVYDFTLTSQQAKIMAQARDVLAEEWDY